MHLYAFTLTHLTPHQHVCSCTFIHTHIHKPTTANIAEIVEFRLKVTFTESHLAVVSLLSDRQVALYDVQFWYLMWRQK